MATTMTQVRAALHKMFNSERYSRFTLQEEDGGNHVEVKMCNGNVDDTDAVEMSGQPEGSPSYRPYPPQQRRRNICYLALGILLVFVIGYLVGYVSHNKPQPSPPQMPTTHSSTTEKVVTVSSVTAAPLAPEPPLNWDDLSRLLGQKLTPDIFSKTLMEFDMENLMAGSVDDERLGGKIYDSFEAQGMKPWVDVHYVQLQTPNSEKPNRVVIGSEEFLPKGYLAYSADGTVQGKVVYGNYGRQEDLVLLQEKGLELNNSVMLLRAGHISFAQQVANAAALGASAVLIYPDPQSYNYLSDTELYGHVHLGAGDPYTPGFPSFNHTQFPPTRSSGLPTIPAQTITAKMATTILQMMRGPESSSTFHGGLVGVAYRLGGEVDVTVEVHNVPVSRKIQNVFGIIKGLTDPDRFVVLGAQRDAWGHGFARAKVGTAILMELARAVNDMVANDGFKPKRSLVFASWSAGEFGSVGSTEWLEAYMGTIDRRAFTYISLDGAVMGRGSFVASASPLLYGLMEDTMKEVNSPTGVGSVYSLSGGAKWTSNALRPMSLEDPAYPFMASSGIPSVSFHFISPNVEAYPYYGTFLDNMNHLDYQTSQKTGEIAVLAAQFAGRMALRLVHDHVLPLDVTRYAPPITLAFRKLHILINQLTQSDQLSGVDTKWLSSALGSFRRATSQITRAVSNSDINDMEACRILNDRIMGVEHSLLSPYVSPVETPFRHMLLGRGPHTLAAIANTTDMVQLRVQLALATWTLKGSANAMVQSLSGIEGN